MKEAFSLFGTIALRGGEQVNRQLDNVDKNLRHVGESANRMGGRMKGLGTSFRGLGTSAKGFAGVAAAALAALVVATGKAGIAYNARLEQSELQWETLLGTQEKAKKQIEDIQKLAKKTQFDSESVNMMAVYLHNAGVEGAALNKELTKVADVSGAYALPAESAQELVRQMSQVRQAGVAYTEDLNILQDRGVPIYKALAKQLGITTGQVKKMASEGKLTSDIYIKAFDGIAKSVEGSSEKMSTTFTGSISTMQDNFNILAGQLTKPIFDPMVSAINNQVNPALEEMIELTGENGALKSWTSLGNAIKGSDTWFTNFIKGVGNAENALLDFLGVSDKYKADFNSDDEIPKVSVVRNQPQKLPAGYGKPAWPSKKFAEGGYVNRATMFGMAGEAGREVIMPIQHKQNMKPFAQAVAENMAELMKDMGGKVVVESPIFLNGKEMARAITPELDLEMARRKNRQGSLVNRGNL